MARRYYFAAILSFSLLANAFTVPVPLHRLRRATDDIETSNDIEDNAVTSMSSAAPVSSVVTVTIDPFDDDDDDDFEFGGSETTSSGGGSNIFSILKIISALFPGSSSAAIADLIRKYLVWIQTAAPFRRQFKLDNRVEIVHISDAMAQLQKLETKDESDSESSDSKTQETEEDKEGEESVENNGIPDASKQDSDSNLESDQDSDYDEPPGGGDGAGGGILGIIAGLSGGEDGQSDLGTLLATFSGIIANLSSEGDENPGAVIASYLLTSLDTITGGGAGGDPDVSSEEGGDNKPMTDSAGFVSSFLLSLLGDMSKSSSGVQREHYKFFFISILDSQIGHHPGPVAIRNDDSWNGLFYFHFSIR
ncbi:unnamed protein product, partial [Iphiclides podalirius]